MANPVEYITDSKVEAAERYCKVHLEQVVGAQRVFVQEKGRPTIYIANLQTRTTVTDIEIWRPNVNQ